MKFIITSILFFANFICLAQLNHLHPVIPASPLERSAGCTPPNASTYMELNNVKALIHTAGNLWQIAGQNFCHYEVPKGSGIMSLFTSSLWLGGVDFNGQLKLAALRYRNGQDYWTGPLSTGGEAEIIPETCLEYDRHFRITREEVAQFAAWHLAGLQDQIDGSDTQTKNFPGYQIPESIIDWPAHGDVTLGQPHYLAPFYDNPNGPEGLNGEYNPEIDGDYPWYDINKEVDCHNSREVTLFGDETFWWIMNDKGNIHTETGGEPVGMEIRAQAFAFATNNEINNMTFYNYELINRSTQTLYDTYFGVMVDVALGGPNDDYVGCDVSRGLGYSYNGDSFDGAEMGFKGYGDTPPAVGVDFFEGPYQDNDNLDNPLTENVGDALAQNGIPYSGLGIGYDDNIIDNERFGMRRFLYYNNTGGGGNASQTDPQTAADYYGYLSGFWKDGSPFVYGGNGHSSDGDANPNVLSDFMFPGETDPLGWGTGGNPQANWTEESSNNVPYDRRFAQSAGPFILKPGAVNNITMGVVWARAKSGGPFESVKELFKADDKAQSLFDNCFNVLEGPHAPDIEIQELENQIVLTLFNPITSNNKNEDYVEADPEIIDPGTEPEFDNTYRFQGYKVYQIKSADVSANDLSDIAKARLLYQCDIEDDITKLINYTFDLNMGASVPTVEVNGENKGISHSILVTEDLFATGDRTLINFQTYYYMAIAYSSNNYKTYTPGDPNTADGQKRTYLGSRKAAIGEVKPYSAIPHNPSVEAGGTIYGTYYGWEPKIKQIEGFGNAGNELRLSANSIQKILDKNVDNSPEFENGFAPFKIKVIDPLNVLPGRYEFIFNKGYENESGGIVDSAHWLLVRHNELEVDSVYSDFSIDYINEQLIPEWGISVTIKQSYFRDIHELSASKWLTDPITSSIEFSDSTEIWLAGIEDTDINFSTNWILSGTNTSPDDADPSCSPDLWINNPCYYYDRRVDDPDQLWESLLGGTITSTKYVGYETYGMPLGKPNENGTPGNQGYFTGLNKSFFTNMKVENLHDVNIVFTPNEDLWTKCVVLEINDNESQTIGGSDVLEIRNQTSVDKKGIPVSNTNDKGMGWFPGYAINVNTGQRLNMAFSENSWLAGENGDDMIWNPTSNLLGTTGTPLMGGMHYVYVFNKLDDMPVYDEGKYIYDNLSLKSNTGHKNVFKTCTWVYAPLAIANKNLLACDVTIRARVNKPLSIREENKGVNKGRPKYEFTITGLEQVSTNERDELESKLDIINIVPNPYYAYSKYELTRLDNRVKFTNLPEECTIRIFNMTGQLIKTIKKSNTLTYVDWSLVNEKNVPISSGLYIIHIEVPGVGEKILKWYGSMRQEDFDNL